MPDKLIADVLNRGSVHKSRMASHSREKFFIHVSDLMQSTTERKFCARQHAITFVENRGEAIARRVTPGMELLHTFGHGAQDHITRLFIERSQYGHTVWGDWGCGCHVRSKGERGIRVRQSLKPHGMRCNECGSPVDHYIETDLIQTEFRLVGHPDLLILWNGMLHIYECKTIERTTVDFDTLVNPLGEHTLQATFYFWMAFNMHQKGLLPYPVSPLLRYLYIDRSSTKLFGGEPYRELIKRASPGERIRPLLANAKMLIDKLDGNLLPERICDRVDSTRAKNCPVAVSCFNRKRYKINAAAPATAKAV